MNIKPQLDKLITLTKGEDKKVQNLLVVMRQIIEKSTHASLTNLDIDNLAATNQGLRDLCKGLQRASSYELKKSQISSYELEKRSSDSNPNENIQQHIRECERCISNFVDKMSQLKDIETKVNNLIEQITEEDVIKGKSNKRFLSPQKIEGISTQMTEMIDGEVVNSISFIESQLENLSRNLRNITGTNGLIETKVSEVKNIRHYLNYQKFDLAATSEETPSNNLLGMVNEFKMQLGMILLLFPILTVADIRPSNNPYFFLIVLAWIACVFCINVLVKKLSTKDITANSLPRLKSSLKNDLMRFFRETRFNNALTFKHELSVMFDNLKKESASVVRDILEKNNLKDKEKREVTLRKQHNLSRKQKNYEKIIKLTDEIEITLTRYQHGTR